MTSNTPFEDDTPPPPDGYPSWLDHAVRSFSGRQAWNLYMFDDRWGDVPSDAYTARV